MTTKTQTLVKNVKQCQYCQGPIDRHGGPEKVTGYDFPMTDAFLQCRDCGSIGDCNVGIMEPPIKKLVIPVIGDKQ